MSCREVTNAITVQGAMLYLYIAPRAEWALAGRDHPPPARPRIPSRDITTLRANNRRDMDVHERVGTTLRRTLLVRPPADALAECAMVHPCQGNHRERIRIFV